MVDPTSKCEQTTKQFMICVLKLIGLIIYHILCAIWHIIKLKIRKVFTGANGILVWSAIPKPLYNINLGTKQTFETDILYITFDCESLIRQFAYFQYLLMWSWSGVVKSVKLYVPYAVDEQFSMESLTTDRETLKLIKYIKTFFQKYPYTVNIESCAESLEHAIEIDKTPEDGIINAVFKLRCEGVKIFILTDNVMLYSKAEAMDLPTLEANDISIILYTLNGLNKKIRK